MKNTCNLKSCRRPAPISLRLNHLTSGKNLYHFCCYEHLLRWLEHSLNGGSEARIGSRYAISTEQVDMVMESLDTLIGREAGRLADRVNEERLKTMPSVTGMFDVRVEFRSNPGDQNR